MKHYQKIFKIKVINDINRNWGITPMFTVSRLAYMSFGTATCILEAVPCVQLCGLNSNACRKSAYIQKIKIKCYKTDVCRLPSHMVCVLHMLIYFNMLIHVYTIHSIKYNLPIHIYKFCLNIAYHCLITIYIKMLPELLHLKPGKSTYF